MKISAIIFDLDGTLLNTLNDIATTHNQMLLKLGYPTHDMSAYQQFIGNGAAKCVERCLPHESRNSSNIAEGIRIQQLLYDQAWANKTHCYEGVSELLTSLQRRHIQLAVLSNKDDRFTRQIIRHFFPDSPFQLVLGHQPGVPHKPDPRGAEQIAKRLNCLAGDVMVVGDSAMDIETALAAGMQATGVSWGFRTIEELQLAGASSIIHHPSELLELLDRQTT